MCTAHLVEVDVVPEVGVSIELGVSTVDSSSPSIVSAENVNDSMLNLLRNGGQVHVLFHE